MKNYVSLIMDIEKSRTYTIEDRIEIQQYILYCIEKLNELYEDNIERKVTFSAGDELQGLFNDVTTAVMYFRLLDMLLQPVKLRAGIGVGEWTIKVENYSSTYQDGPAYHKAREAIKQVYNNSLYNLKIISDQDDIMANYLINATKNLKDQQINMQNIVLNIWELFCPFVKTQVVLNKYQLLQELIGYKYAYEMGRKNNIAPLRKDYMDNLKLNFTNFTIVKPIIIDGKLEEVDKYLFVKNIDTLISEVLKCSRQNVNSILKRGNSHKIKELDYVALQYIERNYKQ